MGMSKGRFLGLLIGMLLALGAAEFLGRLNISSNRHLPRTPNLEVQLYPEQAELFGISGETRHTTSSIGLRGPEPKTTDRLHILCVGGSTTACEYLDDQETWPQLLAAQFPETPTWVGNAGLSGHRAIDHVTLLSKLLEEQKPLDVVILLAGINDLAVAAEGRQATEPKPTSSAQIRRVFHSQPRDFSLWPPAQTGIYAWLQSLRSGRWEVAALEDPAAGSYAQRRKIRAEHLPASATLPSLDKALAAFEKHLTWSCRAAARRGVRPVIVTHPFLWGAGETICAQRCWFGWSGALPWDNPNAYIPLSEMKQGMHAFNRSARLVAAREQALLVDLDHLNGNPDLFYDDCHFNEAGAKAVAQAVGKALRSSAPDLFQR